VQAAITGLGIIHLSQDWPRPHFESGALVPALEPWRQRASAARPVLLRAPPFALAAARVFDFIRES